MAENQSTVENAKEKLDRWLKDGITTPGGKLPSERELGELLGIKRMTLRQALLNLEAESKIFRKDRKGWFVTQPRFNYSPELSASFQRAAIEQGREPSWGFTEKNRTSDIPETLAPLIAVTPSTELYRITGWGRWKDIKFSITKHILILKLPRVLLNNLKTTHFLQSGKSATKKRR